MSKWVNVIKFHLKLFHLYLIIANYLITTEIEAKRKENFQFRKFGFFDFSIFEFGKISFSKGPLWKFLWMLEDFSCFLFDTFGSTWFTLFFGTKPLSTFKALYYSVIQMMDNFDSNMIQTYLDMISWIVISWIIILSFLLLFTFESMKGKKLQKSVGIFFLLLNNFFFSHEGKINQMNWQREEKDG